MNAKMELQEARIQMQIQEHKFKAEQDLILKKAELEYDKRQTLRDEKLKQWMDSQVLQHLFMADQSEGEVADLTSKFCELQVELHDLKSENDCLRTEIDSLNS